MSYDNTVTDSPDVEVFCGGVNEKPSIGAALWRQGHLLHFGFDLAPLQMNDAGRALLVNSIVYIARFRHDRAICATTSVFAGGARPRSSLAGFLNNDDYPVDWFTAAIAPEALAGVKSERAALQEWFVANRGFLRPGADGKYLIDADAQSFGLAYERAEALAAWAAALPAEPAARLLARFVPDGPGAAAGRAEWTAWLAANGRFLFFSEWGGNRWYVDPLARARGVPSDGLRGPARADR